MDLTGKKVLFVVADKNFRDEELFEPKSVLENYGVKISVADVSGKEARGMLGGRIEINITIEKVNVNDYDAIIFVGGSGSTIYWNNKIALNIAKESFLKGKVIASICLASGTLANAGIFREKNATGWPDTKKLVEDNGGTYTGKDLEINGRVISAKGPSAAKIFGEAVAKALVKNLGKE